MLWLPSSTHSQRQGTSEDNTYFVGEMEVNTGGDNTVGNEEDLKDFVAFELTLRKVVKM